MQPGACNCQPPDKKQGKQVALKQSLCVFLLVDQTWCLSLLYTTFERSVNRLIAAAAESTFLACSVFSIISHATTSIYMPAGISEPLLLMLLWDLCPGCVSCVIPHLSPGPSELGPAWVQVVARGSCHSNEGLKLEEVALRAEDAKLLLRGGLLGPTQNATLMLTDFPVALLQPLFR